MKRKMRKKHLILIAMAVYAMSSFPQFAFSQGKENRINHLNRKEKKEGFILMFNGKTTDGWRGYNLNSFPEEGWIIEDGILRCIGAEEGQNRGKGGDIIFDQKFLDFHLKLEWKISKGGNSGIFYLAKEIEDDYIWKSAPEMQILDNDSHPDTDRGVNGNRKSGSLYDIIPAVPQNANPAGEWNVVEIIVYRGKVTHRMNGKDVVEYQMDTQEWKNLIENSKFRRFEWFGRYEAGYIGLQDHGDDVWFRNIKIKEL